MNINSWNQQCFLVCSLEEKSGVKVIVERFGFEVEQIPDKDDSDYFIIEVLVQPTKTFSAGLPAILFIDFFLKQLISKLLRLAVLLSVKLNISFMISRTNAKFVNIYAGNLDNIGRNITILLTFRFFYCTIITVIFRIYSSLFHILLKSEWLLRNYTIQYDFMKRRKDFLWQNI